MRELGLARGEASIHDDAIDARPRVVGEDRKITLPLGTGLSRRKAHAPVERERPFIIRNGNGRYPTAPECCGVFEEVFVKGPAQPFLSIVGRGPDQMHV